MSAIAAWWWFWVAAFLIAGAGFAVIAAIVLVRGFQDLRVMIRLLEEEKKRSGTLL